MTFEQSESFTSSKTPSVFDRLAYQAKVMCSYCNRKFSEKAIFDHVDMC